MSLVDCMVNDMFADMVIYTLLSVRVMGILIIYINSFCLKKNIHGDMLYILFFVLKITKGTH